MADDERKGVRQWAARSGSVLVMLSVLYVLSSGPALLWYDRLPDDGVQSTEKHVAMRRFYAPLSFIHDNSPQAASALDWYLGLWIPQ
jgi:hypothetical protein